MSKPKIVHIWSGATENPDTKRRQLFAQSSWAGEAAVYGNWIERDLSNMAPSRDATSVGDTVKLPFIHDMIEQAAPVGDDDIIFITNADICVLPGTGDEIAKLCSGQGACFAYRWDFDRLDSLLLTKEQISKGKWYIGCDAFAFTKRWWNTYRANLPDFILGRECWDWIMRALIVESGGAELQQAIYHEKHPSPWKVGRLYQPGNLYNRSYARAWLEERGMDLREIKNAPFKPVEWKSTKIERQVSKQEAHAPLGTDVLIVLGRGSKWENNELRYCLRGLERHAKNMGRIFVIGQDPGFLNAEHVTVVPRDDFGKNKEHNIAEQISYAAAKLPLTENFLWVNDDFFFLQNTDISTYPYYNDGDLTEKWNKAKAGGYRVALTQTDAQLKAHELPNRNYEVHVPIMYARRGFAQPIIQKFLKLSSRVPFGMTFRSIYCNCLGVKPGPQYTDMKLGNVDTAEELRIKTAGRHCFSIGDGLSDDAKGQLQSWFPSKSKYET